MRAPPRRRAIRYAQGSGPHHPDTNRRERQRDGSDQLDSARAEDGNHDTRHDEGGNGGDDLNTSLQKEVDHPTAIATDEAEEAADDGSDESSRKGNEQGCPKAVQGSREEISSEFIGAERMLNRGGLNRIAAFVAVGDRGLRLGPRIPPSTIRMRVVEMMMAIHGILRLTTLERCRTSGVATASAIPSAPLA